MSANNIGHTMSEIKKQLDGVSYNLERISDPNARRIDTTMSVEAVGRGKAYSIKAIETRATDPLQEKNFNAQISRLENANIYTEYLGNLQTVVSGNKEKTVSILVENIDKFFAHVNKLESNSDLAMKQALIDNAKDICKAITSASDKVSDLRLEADNAFKASANTANTAIRAIFDLNQELLRSGASIRLHDQRDKLIREVALNFDIDVSYGVSGTANIQSRSSGELIVGSDYYTAINYSGIPGLDAMVESNSIPSAQINHFTKDHKLDYSNILVGGTDDSTMLIQGGKMGALVDLRDNVLPENGNRIKALGFNFAEQINKVHNNGSPIPPKTHFESSVKVNINDTLDLDPFTIYFVDPKGEQLRGGGGRLNTAVIDMKNLRSSSEGSAANIADLIKELNEKLDLAPSRARAAIGAMFDGSSVPVQINKEYLINNIQLRATESAHGGNFTFDLDLQGNAHCGSIVEVLEARTEDIGGANQQAVPTNQLPGSFNLQKDKNIATGQNITVSNATTGRIITLRIRVTGENGEVSEGNVSFRANPSAVVNDRIAFDNNFAGATSGGFIDPTLIDSHSGVAKAKFIDDTGNEIDPSSGQYGKLVITTNDDQYRLVIQGGDFAHRFGFNNLFNFDDKRGKLSVNPDIANDVSKLSIGRAMHDEGIMTAHTVGDVRAKATMVFGGGALAAGDTITIDAPNMAPVVFTFVNALSAVHNPNEVLVAGGLSGPSGLIEAINNHPLTHGLVVADDAGGNVTITAKAAGTRGNSIRIATNLAGGATVDINQAGAAAIHGATDLDSWQGIAGTNKVVTSQVFNYTIKPGNKQVITDLSALQTKSFEAMSYYGAIPGTVTNLSGLATTVTGLLSNNINVAKSTSDVAQNTLELTKTRIQAVLGINKEEELLKTFSIYSQLSAITHLNVMEHRTRMNIIDSITS